MYTINKIVYKQSQPKMSNIMDAMNNTYQPVLLDVPPPRMTMEGLEEIRRILEEQFRQEQIVVEQQESLSDEEFEEMLTAQLQYLNNEPESDYNAN